MNTTSKLVKVIQVQKNGQNWFYTGRTRKKSGSHESYSVYTKDVAKIPGSGKFYYKLDNVWPERGLDWRNSFTLQLTLDCIAKYHKDASNVKVLTYKEEQASYTLQND